MRRWIDWFGDGSCAVLDLPLACCAIETEFAVPDQATRYTELPPGAQPVVVVSGTLTDALAPMVRDTITAIDPAPYVIAFGACSSAGGPYWDSYAVTKGVDQLVNVDLYIAGCPPPPQALTAALEGISGDARLAGRVAT